MGMPLLRHRKRFAIYGAGELGRNLVALLISINHKPEFLIDQSTTNDSTCHGIPIKTIEDIDSTSIESVLIASIKFKDEIRNLINEKLPRIEILES